MKTIRNKADTELVRQQNRSLVLEALRTSGALAGIELGEKTGLSPATISAITNDMLSERLIEMDREETEKIRNARRGRPKVKLKLAEAAALILGIRITHNTISLLVADFCATIKARHSIRVETAILSRERFSATLVEGAIRFLNSQNIDPTQISIISTACQGSVDAGNGEIIWSPAFSARNIAIAEPLSAAFGCPCIVANDTNTIAHLLHVEDQTLADSFAVLYLGSGIGLGLYVNGALLEGSDGSASEFGHMLWHHDGALCRCGRRGCIEAYAADFGIYRTANKELEGVSPADIAPADEDMHRLAAAARNDDNTARTAFNQAGKAIGDGLSDLVLLINPRTILLTGPGTAHFDLLEEGIQEALFHANHNGNKPAIAVLDDTRDLIEAGLLALACTRLDREIFAKRVSVADVAARQAMASPPR